MEIKSHNSYQVPLKFKVSKIIYKIFWRNIFNTYLRQVLRYFYALAVDNKAKVKIYPYSE